MTEKKNRCVAAWRLVIVLTLMTWVMMVIMGVYGEKIEIDMMKFEDVIAKKVETDRSETVAMNEKWCEDKNVEMDGNKVLVVNDKFGVKKEIVKNGSVVSMVENKELRDSAVIDEEKFGGTGIDDVKKDELDVKNEMYVLLGQKFVKPVSESVKQDERWVNMLMIVSVKKKAFEKMVLKGDKVRLKESEKIKIAEGMISVDVHGRRGEKEQI